LFHFLLEEAGNRVVGPHKDLRRRRYIFIRTLTHKGIKAALDKVKGKNVDSTVEDFFRALDNAASRVAVPPFVQNLAVAFLDSQAKRHDADYDLNKQLSDGRKIVGDPRDARDRSLAGGKFGCRQGFQACSMSSDGPQGPASPRTVTD
jgi:hypothetical protein